MGSLDGQVAVVTGGGRGVGRATAFSLAAHGASVAVIARSPDETKQTAEQITGDGGRATAVTVDVTDARSVQEGFLRIREELGSVDVLVNNAGRNSAFGPVWECDPTLWWGDIAVNLFGPFLCSAAVLPSMIARGCGRIINLASPVAGKPFPFNTAYATSKAALVRLTDCLAAETEGTGVSVFALAPGPVKTQLITSITESPEGSRYMGEMLDRLTFISPDIAAEAIAYLASGKADALSGRWFDSVDNLELLAGSAAQIREADLHQLRTHKLSI